LPASQRRRVSKSMPVDPTRSRVMAAIRSRNTTPERLVRSLAHRLGFRFRLHRRDLPGSPDIVFPKFAAVILVHGCFWHRHKCPAGRKRPRTNSAYWRLKFARNVVRDIENIRALRRLGWRVLVLWECELKHLPMIERKLYRFLTRTEKKDRNGVERNKTGQL